MHCRADRVDRRRRVRAENTRAEQLADKMGDLGSAVVKLLGAHLRLA